MWCNVLGTLPEKRFRACGRLRETRRRSWSWFGTTLTAGCARRPSLTRSAFFPKICYTPYTCATYSVPCRCTVFPTQDMPFTSFLSVTLLFSYVHRLSYVLLPGLSFARYVLFSLGMFAGDRRRRSSYRTLPGGVNAVQFYHGPQSHVRSRSEVAFMSCFWGPLVDGGWGWIARVTPFFASCGL